MTTLTLQKNTGEIITLDYEKKQNGLNILSASSPSLSHLVGSYFPDLESLQRSAQNLLLSNGVLETLDRILLTEKAYLLWQKICTDKIQQLKKLRISTEAIGYEMAQPLDAGRLRIWCEVKGTSNVELILEHDSWSWAQGLASH